MPEWTEHLRSRLARLQLDPARESEIVEELSQHLEQRYEELRNGGTGEAEARRLALDELLEPGALADHMRSLRQAHVPPPVAPGAPSRSLLADLGQDLRYAVRRLAKERAFGAAAVLTLALGIGANSAIFALVDATLLRPLPFPEADRLVMMWERTDDAPRRRVSRVNVQDWSEQNRTFDRMASFFPHVGGMVMSGADGTAESVSRQRVGAGVFDVLGVRPVVGRTFLPSDERQRANVVLLSEAFWRTRFGADPNVVGRPLRLDGAPYTVVGVMPIEAQLIGRSNVWALDTRNASRGMYGAYAIGRLKRGVGLEVAHEDLNAVAAGLAREFPETNKGRGVMLEPLATAVIGRELRQTSLLFLGVVGLVLLICCANVANLLLTRATVRRRELAVRSALGADRSRVVRQLLAESLLLSAIGGVMGVGLGAAILHVAPSLIPPDLLTAAVRPAFDARVLGFCAATVLVVGVLFGLAPAWQATDFSLAQVFASEGRTSSGRGGRLRGGLVVAEVATAVVLLFGAGLLLRSLAEVDGVDRGYRAEAVLTMLLDPLDASYPTEASLLQFYDAVAHEVRARPGVRHAAWASTLPLGLSYAGRSPFVVVGEPVVEESRRPTADYQVVSPDYFQTLDLPIVAGRGFDDRDTRAAAPVCMVNEGFVRRHLQGRSATGVRVAIHAPSSGQPLTREIVGVARQVKGRPDEAEDFVQIYVPLAQDTPGDLFLVVQPASGRADALAPSVRAAIAQIDREQLVGVRRVMTLEDVAAEATARYRFRAVLVMTFAGLALLLAMVGVFGVLAYSVEQRVRDVGVRRALGATTGDVLRLVVGNALRVIATGAAIGLALSAIFSRLIVTLLFGVQPWDAPTVAAVAVVLALMAAVSIAGPAWRVVRIEPVAALRAE